MFRGLPAGFCHSVALVFDRYGADVLAAAGSGGIGEGDDGGLQRGSGFGGGDGSAGGSGGGSGAGFQRGGSGFQRGNASTRLPAHRAAQQAPRQVLAIRGLVVEEPLTGWVGAITRVEKTAGMYVVTLEDNHRRLRTFPLTDQFWIDGEPITLVRQITQQLNNSKPKITASGSVAAPNSQRAKTARASRIWVEGRHDAELIEQVWGDDLREVGVVVEMLDGVDNLSTRLHDFAPTLNQRVGVLVDHLIAGTKESRLVENAIGGCPAGSVMVRGHKFVDIWQAIRPARLGMAAWPTIPHHIEWKQGILAHLGWPYATQTDIANGWKRILRQVRNYRDLEPSLLGPVEELIDFVTVDSPSYAA